MNKIIKVDKIKPLMKREVYQEGGLSRCRNLRIPTSSDIESGSLGSPRERQVNIITESVRRQKD